MELKYRYPGVRPFEVEDAALFFGREKEADFLSKKLLSENLLVIHSRSGLGKSSLINAGLKPKFINEYGLTPVSVRFQAFQSEGFDYVSPLVRLGNHFEAESEWIKNNFEPDRNDLWYKLKSMQLNGVDKQLLIFDQFEELFTYPEKDIIEFCQGLSEVFSVIIPDRFRAMLGRFNTSSYQDANLVSKIELLHTKLEFSILIAIRSDKYHLLSKLNTFFPTLMKQTYELKPLQVEDVESAIVNPAYQPGEFRSSRFDFEDDAIDYMVNFLSNNRTAHVESFQLQVLCEYVERSIIINTGARMVNRSDVVNPTVILEQYYLDKLDDLSLGDQYQSVRKFIEEGLVLEEDFRRLTLFEEQIFKFYGVKKTNLEKLVSSHLLRSEKNERGGYVYELSHDTLVAPVIKAKNQRKLAENKILEIREKEVEARRFKEEMKKKRRALMFGLVMALIAAGAFIALIFAYQQNLKTKAAEQVALERQMEAENALFEKNQLEIEKLISEIDILLEANLKAMALEKIMESLKEFPDEPILIAKRKEIKSSIK